MAEGGMMVENGEGIQRRALAAAGQASEALNELLRAAQEGDFLRGPFDPEIDVVDKLLDAAKIAMEIEHDYVASHHRIDPDYIEAREQILAAVTRYLTGWAG